MSRSTIVQLCLMGAVALGMLWLGHPVAASALAVLAAGVGLLAVTAPDVLATLQQALERGVGWVATGLGLVLLTLVYLTVFVPGGLWLRLRGVDWLNRALPTDGRSNWVERVGHGEDPDLYHKQYTRPHAGAVSSAGERP